MWVLLVAVLDFLHGDTTVAFRSVALFGVVTITIVLYNKRTAKPCQIPSFLQRLNFNQLQYGNRFLTHEGHQSCTLPLSLHCLSSILILPPDQTQSHSSRLFDLRRLQEPTTAFRTQFTPHAGFSNSRAVRHAQSTCLRKHLRFDVD